MRAEVLRSRQGAVRQRLSVRSGGRPDVHPRDHQGARRDGPQRRGPGEDLLQERPAPDENAGGEVILFTSPKGRGRPRQRSGEGKYQRIAMITIQRGADGAPLTRSLPLATSPGGRGY